MRRARLLAVLVTLALVVVGGAGCSSSGDDSAGDTTTTVTLPPATAAAFQKALDATRARVGFPGVIAGVWTPAGAWTGVSGVAKAGGAAPPRLDQHTRIGSVTKTFTVTLLLQLAQEGALSLDDKIGKWFPDVPNAQTATLGQLADMTSGIPSYTTNESFQRQLFADPQRSFTPDELLFFATGQPPSFPAGTQFEYSNTNTLLLGLVIEEVTGRPFADVLRERILSPLGLAQTSFPASAALPKPHWSGITDQGQPEGETADATNWNPSWAYTAGSMISTLEDLHRWGVALGTGDGILDPAMQAQRAESLALDPAGPTRAYGLGAGNSDGWIGHTGELPGFNTVVLYSPEAQTTIVVMVNSDVPFDEENPAPAVFDALEAALEQRGERPDFAPYEESGDQTQAEPQT
jgi:D-alanyl-D-alanine carboxypeptidase